tara:strand:+ start:1139 stop:1555 length:417 start_codon:yes stop_codon:yes gene_type:complete
MSYILESENASGSPFCIVTCTAPTAHPNTIVDADWVTFNAGTFVLSVESTDAYYEYSMSYNRTVSKGVLSQSLDPNGTSDTHTWSQIFVAGNIAGAGSYARGDDTAYCVDSSTMLRNRYSVGSYTVNTDRAKAIVRRL